MIVPLWYAASALVRGRIPSPDLGSRWKACAGRKAVLELRGTFSICAPLALCRARGSGARSRIPVVRPHGRARTGLCCRKGISRRVPVFQKHRSSPVSELWAFSARHRLKLLASSRIMQSEIPERVHSTGCPFARGELRVIQVRPGRFSFRSESGLSRCPVQLT